jgi:hypothetical protein
MHPAEMNEAERTGAMECLRTAAASLARARELTGGTHDAFSVYEAQIFVYSAALHIDVEGVDWPEPQAPSLRRPAWLPSRPGDGL